MFDLTTIDNILPHFPAPEIRIDELRIDIEPSDHSILPEVHIDASVDIRFR